MTSEINILDQEYSTTFIIINNESSSYFTNSTSHLKVQKKNSLKGRREWQQLARKWNKTNSISWELFIFYFFKEKN